MKGSFLHKALSVEKVVENASPKRVRIRLHFDCMNAFRDKTDICGEICKYISS